MDGAGDKAHDRDLLEYEHRYRDGAHLVASLGIDPVQVVELVTQVVLELVGRRLQGVQAPGVVDAIQFGGQLFLGAGFQGDLVAPGANADSRHPQLLVELLVVTAAGLMGATEPGFQLTGRGERGETGGHRCRVGQAQPQLKGVEQGSGVAVHGQQYLVQLGAPGDREAHRQLVLQGLQLGARIFQHRKLGEGGVARGDDGRAQPVGLGLGVLHQEPVVRHGGEDGVAGGLVEVEAPGHFSEPEGLGRVGHEQVQDGQCPGGRLGEKCHCMTPVTLWAGGAGWAASPDTSIIYCTWRYGNASDQVSSSQRQSRCGFYFGGAPHHATDVS